MKDKGLSLLNLGKLHEWSQVAEALAPLEEGQQRSVYFLCSLEQLLVNPSGPQWKEVALTIKAYIWEMAVASQKKKAEWHPPPTAAEGLEATAYPV